MGQEKTDIEEGAAPQVSSLPRREANLWSDAWRRLRKNRAAMLGLVIIVLIFLTAIFADDTIFAIFLGREPQPLLAPMSYETQCLEDNNAAPYWVTVVFPTMRIRQDQR
jgi:ABC-type antimicrobial peptide transport system permease subunit